MIVYLHEGLGAAAQWRDFADQLGVAALLYDRRGHGAAGPLPGPLTPSFMHDEARLLGELLVGAGISEPIVVGHSDGASIAILHAAAGACRALVLLSPHVFVEELTVGSIAELVPRYHDPGDGLRASLIRQHGDKADALFAAWTGVWLSDEFRGWNIEGALAGVRCPVLVIQGLDDPFGTIDQVRAIQRGIPSAEAVLLSQCAHHPHLEQPATTLETVREFLTRPRPDPEGRGSPRPPAATHA